MKFTVTYKSRYAKTDGNSYKAQIEAPDAESAWTIASTRKGRLGYRVILIEPATTRRRDAA